jgi:hypothetical protein
MVNNHIRTPVPTHRIIDLLSLIAKPKSHITNNHIGCGNIDFIVSDTYSIPGSRLSGNGNAIIDNMQQGFQYYGTGNLKNYDTRTRFLNGSPQTSLPAVVQIRHFYYLSTPTSYGIFTKSFCSGKGYLLGMYGLRH